MAATVAAGEANRSKHRKEADPQGGDNGKEQQGHQHSGQYLDQHDLPPPFADLSLSCSEYIVKR